MSDFDQNEVVGILVYSILKNNDKMRNDVITFLMSIGVDIVYIENMIVAAKNLANQSCSILGEGNIKKFLDDNSLSIFDD